MFPLFLMMEAVCCCCCCCWGRSSSLLIPAARCLCERMVELAEWVVGGSIECCDPIRPREPAVLVRSAVPPAAMAEFDDFCAPGTATRSSSRDSHTYGTNRGQIWVDKCCFKLIRLSCELRLSCKLAFVAPLKRHGTVSSLRTF